jgi:putative oxidoreductase
MSDITGEPRRIIPALGPFYDNTRDISWLIVRLTAGGFLLIHGLQKLINATFTVWAANVLSKRGIEPAIPLAYCVWFIETVGAVCIMLGLYTRVFVAMAGVQMLVIIFFAHWGGGFAGFPWNRPTGGWEYPAFWGCILLAIGLRGGGPYSLDRKLGREL